MTEKKLSTGIREWPRFGLAPICLTRDPIGYAGGINFDAFVGDNACQGLDFGIDALGGLFITPIGDF